MQKVILYIALQVYIALHLQVQMCFMRCDVLEVF